MLLNPYRTALRTHPGTRIVETEMGLIGSTIQDPRTLARTWEIVRLYAPIPGRQLGGIRARLEDNKGFTTFCNQRDLELLLGLAKPGDLCPWTDASYPAVTARDFYGLCADDDDLDDDLFERELYVRQELAQSPAHSDIIPFGYELMRRVHLGGKHDVEEVSVMLYDCDQESGLGPDPRLETIRYRWSRADRQAVNWLRV